MKVNLKKKLSAAIMATASFTGFASDEVEVLSIKGSEGNLYAELQNPAPEGEKVPLVIICHGFTANCNVPLLTDAADDLENQGISSLRFDFNGHGKSEGEFQNMTVLNEIEDLKDVVKWAQSQPWVDSISLLGHSQGGVVVSMAAGELGDSVIKNVVLMAPAAVLRDDALRGNTIGALYDPWNFEGDYVELPMGGLKLGRKYIEAAVNLPIYETAWRYTGPVLVIQGSHDRIVPYTYAERYVDGYQNGTLKIIPDEDHSFTRNTAEAALYAADWLTKQIKTEAE